MRKAAAGELEQYLKENLIPQMQKRFAMALRSYEASSRNNIR